MHLDVLTHLVQQFQARPPKWPMTLCFGGHSVTIRKITHFIPRDGEGAVTEMDVVTAAGEPRRYFFNADELTCVYELGERPQ